MFFKSLPSFGRLFFVVQTQMFNRLKKQNEKSKYSISSQKIEMIFVQNEYRKQTHVEQNALTNLIVLYL